MGRRRAIHVGRVTTLTSLIVFAAACTSGGAENDADPTTTVEVATTSADPTTTSAPATTTTSVLEEDHSHDGVANPAEIAASLATAAFQDVSVAEAVGYASTIDALGCFENVASGGMGLHYLNESLLDATLDVTAPEALVYELTADGDVAGLVAHEYIVPIEAWTESSPPAVFGMELHQHPVLPLWVLHAWIWKDNPSGFFNDWNPAVRLCPEGVPVFGEDLP